MSSYDTGVVVDSGIQGEVILDSGSSILNTDVSMPIESSMPVEGSVPVDSGTIIDSSSSYESSKPAMIDEDAALLTVAVPNGATVTVNGHPTSSSGTVRQFMSRGLKEGYVYTYVVKMEYELNGEKKSDSKEVKLRPGDTEQVVFEQEEVKEIEVTKTDAPVTTVVKLYVPSGAKVNLAGNDTNGTGTVRTFRTTSLKAGDAWTDYAVRVTAVINGREVSQQQVVDVAAGSTIELNFDFQSADVAQR